MIYRKFGNTDMKVSPVVYGTMAAGGAFGKPDDIGSILAMNSLLDAGMNMIDTAPTYGMGHAEELIGEVIRERRNKVYIATKCGNTWNEKGERYRCATKESLRAQLKGSLRRLGIDYIDLYQMHWPVCDTPFEESFTELARMQRQGYIRYIGVSNFSAEQMEEVKNYCDIVSLQPPYSLVDRRIEESILPYCGKNGIATLTYGSIGAGVLTGKYKERPVFEGQDSRNALYKDIFSQENWPRTAAIVDGVRKVAAERAVPMVQVAIAWVLARCTVALVGAKSPEQGLMNLAASDIVLTGGELEILNNA